jgi:hypothetical protein
LPASRNNGTFFIRRLDRQNRRKAKEDFSRNSHLRFRAKSIRRLVEAVSRRFCNVALAPHPL